MVMSDDVEVICWLVIFGEGIVYKLMFDVSDDLWVGCLWCLLLCYQGDVVLLNLICLYCKQFFVVVCLLYEEVKLYCEGFNV